MSSRSVQPVSPSLWNVVSPCRHEQQGRDVSLTHHISYINDKCILDISNRLPGLCSFVINLKSTNYKNSVSVDRLITQ